MLGIIVTLIVGVICIVLGVSNMKGDISSIHSYHRQRVSEEDRLAYGKGVGLGTIICGIGIILFSVCFAIEVYTEAKGALVYGCFALTAGLFAGAYIVMRTMKKYNNGIF